MIGPLRRGHVRRHFILGAVAAVGIVFGLGARETPPTAALPVSDLEDRTFEGSKVWESNSVFTELPSRVELLRDGNRYGLRITPDRDPLLPDVLVYWSEEASDELPKNANLLGRLSGAQTRAFALPADGNGHLYLFSLGHQTLVDRGAVGEQR